MLHEQAERLLNRCIGESTRAREYRERLDGRSLSLLVRGTPLALTLRVDTSKLRIIEGVEEHVDVAIEAGPLEAIKLLEVDSVAALRSADAEIRGNLHVADDFAALLRHARPDFEGELARFIGDIPAHGLARFLRGAWAWSREAGRASEQNIADYLKTEVRILPSPLELAGFTRAVERTRDDVARLEQRFDRLARSLTQRSE